MRLLTPMPDATFGTSSATGQFVINVDETQQFQKMVGFGASMIESSVWLLATRLGATARADVLATAQGQPLSMGCEDREQRGSTRPGRFRARVFHHDSRVVKEADPQVYAVTEPDALFCRDVVPRAGLNA
jgi:hypothetical protein